MAIDDDDDYQGTRKRVSLLEVDDDDGSLRLVARRAEEATHRAAAEEAGRRAEAERDAQAAEESMQASRNRRIEMDREAEAQERRNAASRERVALKKAKAAAHSRKSAKDKANNELHKLNYNHYWKTKADGMEAMRHACRDAGFTVTGEIWNESGDLESGRATSMLDLGGDEYGLTITWYQMPSGRWELVAYVN